VNFGHSPLTMGTTGSPLAPAGAGVAGGVSVVGMAGAPAAGGCIALPDGNGVPPFAGGGVAAGGSVPLGVVTGGVRIVGAGVGVTTGGVVIAVDAGEPAIGVTVETDPAVGAPRCALG